MKVHLIQYTLDGVNMILALSSEKKLKSYSKIFQEEKAKNEGIEYLGSLSLDVK